MSASETSAWWRTDADGWDTLSSGEQRVLTSYRQPLEPWGYGNQEAGTPEGEVRNLPIYHLVTSISDVVFRNISHLSRDGRIPGGDTHVKLRNAHANLDSLLTEVRLGDYTTRGLRQDIVAFLDPFIRGSGGEALRQLASQPLGNRAHSPPYIAIVTAANALVCIADGDFGGAWEILDSYVKEYDEHYPDSDDD